MKKITILLALSLVGIGAWATPTHKTSFSITVKGEKSDYTIFSVFVMPRETVPLIVHAPVTVSSETVAVRQSEAEGWELVAPNKPGAYTVTIDHEGGESMRLNVLVLTPMAEMQGEFLHGYRIGAYPSKPLRDNPIYLPPQGLFMLTAQNRNLQLTPHFTLGQFQCKQGGSSDPKFVLVRERLLLKLEYLLEVAQGEGFAIETFGFIGTGLESLQLIVVHL